MIEYQRVVVEVWRVAADRTGLWLLGGDADVSDPIPQASNAHFEVVNTLADARHRMVEGRLQDVPLIHSTSWREDGPWTILTYVAVADVGDDLVLDRYPDALPITGELITELGPPPQHAANERPMPHNGAVLEHGIRHLAFLRIYDSTAAAALPAAWEQHLEPLRPALAGLYHYPGR